MDHINTIAKYIIIIVFIGTVAMVTFYYMGRYTYRNIETVRKGELVIFKASDTSREDNFSERGKPHWTPTSTEIKLLEDLLPIYARINTPKNRRPIRSIYQYFRQYYGITEKGKKIIYLNAFCVESYDEDPYWKTGIISVLDGGNCYFIVKFQSDSKEFYDFYVGGQG